jgi:carnitine-CoA ligase
MFLDDPAVPDTLQQGIEAALERGARIRISFDHVEHTLDDLWADAGRLADHLARTGVRPGDRVGVMARNGKAALISWWAATRAGAIVVPFNVDNTGEFLEHQFADSDPAAFVVQPEFAARLRAARTTVGQDDRPLLLDGSPRDLSDPALSEGDVVPLAEALACSDPAFPGHAGSPRDLSHLVYTSGTTGRSKACMVPHTYVRHFALQVVDNLERQPDELLWTPMPLFHMSAMTHVTGSILIGGSASLAARFSVSRFWEDIERSGAEVAALMGSMLTLLAQAPDTDVSRRMRGRLRVVSGSPVTPELAGTWRERFGVVRVGAGTYGMTEAALITTTPPGGYRPGTAGTATPSFDLRIADADGHPLPAGQVGEIVCRPTRPGIMFDGYWNNPEHTVSVFRDLWFHTGDFGRVDEDGYLTFADRGKDYLRRGGENISSFEMESVFARHEAISEVAVHAVPSPLSEDELKVTAVLSPGAALTEAELYEWALPRVPRYAVPSYIEFREALPKNPVGRVLKYKLREDGVTAASWAAPRRVSASRPA